MFQRLLTLWRQRCRQPKPRPASERRLWGRYPFHREATFQPVSSAEEPRLPALVRNVSAGGIQLAVSRSFEMGTLLTVHLPSHATTMPLLASVIHVMRPTEDTWTLGCSFIRELNDTELRELL